MNPTEPRLGQLAHKVRELDPGSRALLDLSVRRGLGDVEIAGVLGTDPNYIANTRTGVMQSIAADLRLDDRERAELEDALAQLPAEAWLPAADSEPTPNGAGNGVTQVSAVPAPPEPEAPEAEVAAPTADAAEVEAPPAGAAEAEVAEVDTSPADAAEAEVDTLPADAAQTGVSEGDEGVTPEAEVVETEAEEPEAAEAEVAEPEAEEQAAEAEQPETPAAEAEVAEPETEEHEAEAAAPEADAAEAEAEEPEAQTAEAAAEPADDDSGRAGAATLVGTGRRRRRTGAIVASLVLILLAVVLVIALASSDDEGDRADEPAAPAERENPAAQGGTQAQTQELEVLGGATGATGTARLDGRRLVLRVSGLPGAASGYQVWLYDSLIEAKPLGRLRAGDGGSLQGTFPAGQIGRYRYVDISVEPRDGNSNHSGRSVMRIATSDLR